jgi:glycosyltransferase involved in cell wall biosynthesis
MSKILIKQFLSKNMSWSICGWNIAKSAKELGHEVDLFSTDAFSSNDIGHLPKDLYSNLIGYCLEKDPKGQVFGRMPEKNYYDVCFSYTAPINWGQHLQYTKGNKNKLAQWVFEWRGKNILPQGFAKNHIFVDKIVSPSTFGKQIYEESGVPSDKIVVIPHGISSEYLGISTMDLGITKTFKILSNIAQNHIRKNIPGLLDAYGRAFTSKDDVCLILKAKERPITMQFEVSLKDCLSNFYRKYPKHAEIKVMSDFIDDMSALYRSVDCVYSLSHAEGYYLPASEALLSGKINICPRWGGQLDFLNDDNALLVSGKEERALPESMYWEAKQNAIWFQPSIDDAVSKLRYAKDHYVELNKKLEENRVKLYEQYNWKKITKDILSLAE